MAKKKWENRKTECWKCGGSGTVQERPGDPRSPEVTCPECNGEGET